MVVRAGVPCAIQQAMPGFLNGLLQLPVAASQLPAMRHESCAVQTTGFAPVQTPAVQALVWVQALPSLQAVPSASEGFEQVPAAGSHKLAAWH